MRAFLCSCTRFLVVGVVLLLSTPVSAQIMERSRIDPNLYTQPKAAERSTAVGAQMERSRTDPRLYTQPAPAQKSPAAVAQVERPRIDPNLYAQPRAAEKGPAVVERRRFDRDLMVKPFPVEPCELITRDEVSAIMQRSDTDRALVYMPRGSWSQDRKTGGCYYNVNYEKRVLPEEPYDNTVVISIDLDNQYAKQGQLIIDRPVLYGYPMALQVVNGVGDEAVFLTDVSRVKAGEKYRGTAGVNRTPIYDNKDFLLVRYKTVLIKFEITRSVAGSIGSANHIQIARIAIARLNQASGG